MARSVLTIGSFDGVHLGHRALLGAARELAAAHSAKVVALAFDPHPLTTISPDSAPFRLTTWLTRRNLLLQAGADVVIRLQPCRDVLDLAPEAFVQRMVQDHAPRAFVEGPDFHFGCRRAGDIALLARLGDAMDFDAHIIQPVTTVLDDHSIVQVSSTLTRWLLRHGRVGDAARLLGRPYRLEGEVVPGDRRGRLIGFPTANLLTDLMLPADGVYAARAILPDGRILPAALNVGERPTFGGATRTVEAHILSAPPNSPGSVPPESSWAPLAGLPEYHWPLELELVAWLRDQVRFAGVEGLRDQLHRDCDRVREVLDRDASPPIPSHSRDVRAALVAGAHP
jgi:riboflavin kinase/FMN adenylyltransferase